MESITITIEVWGSLSHLFGEERPKRRTLQMNADVGTTLEGLLINLAERYPSFADFYFKPNTTEPNGRVSVIVNNRLPELLDGHETKLNDNDRIVLVQAYEGG